MAVNNNFYKTVNELVNRSVTGVQTEVVDYATFIDFGKEMATLDGEILANGFLRNLLNKFSVTIDTFRTYTGKILGFYRDTTNYGNIEMYKKHFYESRKAPFIGLTDGAQFPDRKSTRLNSSH